MASTELTCQASTLTSLSTAYFRSQVQKFCKSAATIHQATPLDEGERPDETGACLKRIEAAGLQPSQIWILSAAALSRVNVSLGLYTFMSAIDGTPVVVAAAGAGEVGVFSVSEGEAAIPMTQVQCAGDRNVGGRERLACQ
tara:strand:+ start:1149 stop:1571 length:423 start_codon:yes stop_codon:yes gene_type:complete